MASSASLERPAQAASLFPALNRHFPSSFLMLDLSKLVFASKQLEMWQGCCYQGLLLGAALQSSMSFVACWRPLHVSNPFDRGCTGWRTVLVASVRMSLLPPNRLGAEGRLGLGDDPCNKRITLYLYFFFLVWFSRHGACLWRSPQCAQGCGLTEDPSLCCARKCRACFGSCGRPWLLWVADPQPLSPRAFMPYAGITSVFGVKGP